MKTAIIDLGTNTFHLLITDGKEVFFRDAIPAKIGKGGINQGIITEEGIERALKVLRFFREEIDKNAVSQERIFATGTSAIRNAGNKEDFVKRVFDETQIPITIIDGNKEAELIYKGVKQAVSIGKEMAMIIDIGGGSVEFIICTEDRIFWKQSFEIGGQRLMEKFMKTDPISLGSVRQLDTYFREQLLPLANACHQYSPKLMVGSSGSFDTLIDIEYMRTNGQLPEPTEIGFELPMQSFYESYDAFITKKHDERMQIAGMIELRVDMIVVAVCLIRFIIQTFGIQQIKVSNYALKEGLMIEIFS